MTTQQPVTPEVPQPIVAAQPAPQENAGSVAPASPTPAGPPAEPQLLGAAADQAAPRYDPHREALIAELAYYRREAAKGELQAKAAAYRAQLESDGWPSELATIYVKTWLEKETAQAQVAAANAQHEDFAKHEVARRLAGAFGVSAESLLVYPTPADMMDAARRLGGEAKRISALEAEVKALRGGTVPAQKFDNGRGGINPNNNYQELLKSGGKLPSPAEIDRLTAKYTQ